MDCDISKFELYFDNKFTSELIPLRKLWILLDIV